MRNIIKLGSAGVAVVAAAALGIGVASAVTPQHANGPARSAASPKVTMPTTSETSFVPISPCRIVDTRSGGGHLGGGQARGFHARGTTGFTGQGGTAGGCGIPGSASAINVTVFALDQQASGHLVAYPSGTSAPNATTVSFKKGNGTATGSTAVKLGVNQPYDLRVFTSATTDVIVDVTGYYEPPLNAYVDNDGTLLSTSGRALSSSNPTTGNYLVDFDRDVSMCSYTVTPYDFNWVVAVGPGSTANEVHVFIHDQGSSTTPHDTSFFMNVTC